MFNNKCSIKNCTGVGDFVDPKTQQFFCERHSRGR